MKKTHKFYIIAGAFIFLGIILTVIGFTLGGRVIGMGINGNGFFVETTNKIYGNAYSFGGINSTDLVEEGVTLDPFTSIDLKASFCDVNIKIADHYGIQYQMPGRYTVVYEVENGTLSFKQKSPSDSGFNINFFSLGNLFSITENLENMPSVTILIPAEAAFDLVELQAEGGEISIPALRTDELSVRNTFGAVSVEEIAANELSFYMESGALSASNVSTERLYVENTFGSMDFKQLNVTDTAELQSESCKLNFEDTTFRTVSVKNTFGNINAENITADSLTMHSESGKTRLNGLSVNRLDIESTFGDIDLSLNEPYSDYAYDVETEFGKIVVDGTSLGTFYHSPDTASGKAMLIRGESCNITIEQEH